MEAWNTVDDELEQLVARIRARGAGQTLPQPAPEAVAAFLARTIAEKPLSGEELTEHERMWRAVDEEIRAVERGDDNTPEPV